MADILRRHFQTRVRAVDAVRFPEVTVAYRTPAATHGEQID
jgi:hypothetical protein